ncbi:MAG: hypothetical protein QNJ64_06185 [Crocosphaera sp.]|nr:hypothetical protein [Crocosphaera sp.]
MSLTNEHIEEKINQQSEQIARIDHDLKEVVSKVNNQSEQINKIDTILENQKQSTQQINDLDKRMIGIEGTLKNIESLLKSQESYIQKIPELTEKVNGIEINIAKIDTKIESQQQSTQNLDKEMSEIKGLLEGQKSNMQKIPDLIEKVGELKNWRQIFFLLLTALVTWYLRGVNLKP